jgi:hypothetical protein
MQLRNRTILNTPMKSPMKTPYVKNLFISKLNDVPPTKTNTTNEFRVLSATNCIKNHQTSNYTNYNKYFLILINTLVISWVYYHLVYTCNLDSS